MKFEVIIRYEGVATYIVNAESEEEAEEKAHRRYLDCDDEDSTGGEHEEGKTLRIVKLG